MTAVKMEKEFHLILNFAALSPPRLEYWQDQLNKVLVELSDSHGIRAQGSVGAYVSPQGKESQSFYLFATGFDLSNEADLQKCRALEKKVEATLKKFSA